MEPIQYASAVVDLDRLAVLLILGLTSESRARSNLHPEPRTAACICSASPEPAAFRNLVAVRTVEGCQFRA